MQFEAEVHSLTHAWGLCSGRGRTPSAGQIRLEVNIVACWTHLHSDQPVYGRGSACRTQDMLPHIIVSSKNSLTEAFSELHDVDNIILLWESFTHPKNNPQTIVMQVMVSGHERGQEINATRAFWSTSARTFHPWSTQIWPASIDELPDCVCCTVHRKSLAGNGDLHGIRILVNIDADAISPSQSLYSLSLLPNN